MATSETRRVSPSRGVRAWRWINAFTKNLLGFLIVALLLAITCLCVRGLPEPIAIRLLAKINSGPFAWQLQKLHFCPGGGLVAEDARVFRKAVVGHPLFEAPEVLLDIDLLSLLDDRAFVEGFAIHGGVFRRDTSGQSSSGRTDGHADFKFELRDCDLEGFWIDQCRGSYLIRGSEVVIEVERGLAGLGDQQGAIAGIFSFDRVSHEYDYHVRELEVDPHVLVPMLRGRNLNPVADLIERFEFTEGNPCIELRLQGKSGADPVLHMEGRITSGSATYRSVAYTALDVSFRGEFSQRGKTLVLSPLKMEYGQESILADCTLDLVAATTEFQATSTMHPQRAARILGDKVEAALQGAHFGAWTEIEIKGIVGHKDPEITDVQATIEGDGLGFGPFVTERCGLTWTLRARSNHFANINGEMWGGDIQADALVFPNPASTSGMLRVSFDVDRIAFADYAKHVLKRSGEDYAGLLSFDGSLQGDIKRDWMKGADGRFHVKIEDGKLFRLRLFGGLTDIITKFIKPLDRMLEQTTAEADVVVGDGGMTTDNLKIEGKLLGVEASGRCGFDRSLEFEVKVTPRDKSLLQKIIKLPFDVLNELFFEIGLTGELEDPKWYLRRFSKHIFD
ncbi:MAG: hypothetical protein O2923_11710 [Verrucomicrobia bacterium]|nr:hypothetical protein [Verrucomicrobiota bacterium]